MARTYLSEFDSAEACERAIVALKELGANGLEAYLPYRSPRVEAALGGARSPLPRWVLAAGFIGAGVAYLILYWTQNVDYPLDVGGRPTHAVAAYVPITFETTVLFASVTAFVGALYLCRLPRLHHRIFEVPGFERASIDRFFVVFRAGEGVPEEAELVAAATAQGAHRTVPVDFGKEGP
jgi:hypothetical protein